MKTFDLIMTDGTSESVIFQGVKASDIDKLFTFLNDSANIYIKSGYRITKTLFEINARKGDYSLTLQIL